MLESFVAVQSFSQQESNEPKLMKLVLKDGSELIGTIIAEDSVSVNFNTAGNILITIPQEQIKARVRLQDRNRKDEHYCQDPNDVRLFVTPTARSLESGEINFFANELFCPILSGGIANLVTLGGGVSLFPSLSNQFIYLSPKITPVHIGRLDVAGGLVFIHSPEEDEKNFGMYYVVSTYGSQEAAFTASLGWSYEGSDVANKPVVMLGGEFQLSNNVKFMTDNWLMPNSEVDLLSFGLRFFNKRVTGEFALIFPTNTELDGWPFIPWLSFSYNFGLFQ